MFEFVSVTTSLYITVETNMKTIAYPPLEGTNISLKCDKTGLDEPEANYTWIETAGGQSSGKYLFFDNLTTAQNGGRVRCSSKDNETLRIVSSVSLVLQVYCKYIINPQKK